MSSGFETNNMIIWTKVKSGSKEMSCHELSPSFQWVQVIQTLDHRREPSSFNYLWLLNIELSTSLQALLFLRSYNVSQRIYGLNSLQLSLISHLATCHHTAAPFRYLCDPSFQWMYFPSKLNYESPPFIFHSPPLRFFPSLQFKNVHHTTF